MNAAKEGNAGAVANEFGAGEQGAKSGSDGTLPRSTVRTQLKRTFDSPQGCPRVVPGFAQCQISCGAGRNLRASVVRWYACSYRWPYTYDCTFGHHCTMSLPYPVGQSTADVSLPCSIAAYEAGTLSVTPCLHATGDFGLPRRRG